jgi:outer membrane protein OmpA-like peptidoglycan-associated protein
VGNAVSSVTVTATTTMAGSTMTIEGAAETSGVASAAIPLAVGPTTITVVVTASDTRFTETYEIEVTRAAATGGGGGSWVPSLDVVVPATTLVSGATVGAVIEAGAQVPTVLSRNDSDSGWLGVGEGFSFSVSTRTPSGAPESMTPAGVMRVPAGGSVVISGDGYLPESTVAVFAVPRTQARSDAAAVMRLLGGRADSGAVYLGSANANANGVVNDVISIPASISAGDYVLQINGYTIASQVRSLNLAVNVVAVQRAVMVSKALEYKAFYQGGKDRFTVEGVDKMREIAKSVPKDARNVKVKITGVSVGLGTVAENVELAGKRAQRISDYLVAKGIQGDYEISFTTSFTVGGDRDGVTDKADKPLTTVAISYDLPVTSS